MLPLHVFHMRIVYTYRTGNWCCQYQGIYSATGCTEHDRIKIAYWKGERDNKRYLQLMKELQEIPDKVAHHFKKPAQQ